MTDQQTDVVPIPHERGRFFVQSSSRAGLQHTVDMDFEGKPTCGCEYFQTRPAVKECKHIVAVNEFIRRNQK